MIETTNNNPPPPQGLSVFNKVLVGFAVFVLGGYMISAKWHDTLYHTEGVVLVVTGLWFLLSKLFVENIYLDILILAPLLHYFILKGKGVRINAALLCAQIVVLLLVINITFHRFVDDFTVKSGNSALYPLASKDWGIIDAPVASLGNFIRYMRGVSAQAYSGWESGEYQRLRGGAVFHTIYHYQPAFIFKLYFCMILALAHGVFFVVRRIKIGEFKNKEN